MKIQIEGTCQQSNQLKTIVVEIQSPQEVAGIAHRYEILPTKMSIVEDDVKATPGTDKVKDDVPKFKFQIQGTCNLTRTYKRIVVDAESSEDALKIAFRENITPSDILQVETKETVAGERKHDLKIIGGMVLAVLLAVGVIGGLLYAIYLYLNPA